MLGNENAIKTWTFCDEKLQTVSWLIVSGRFAVRSSTADTSRFPHNDLCSVPTKLATPAPSFHAALSEY